MTEQLETLLRKLIIEQDTVTDRNVRSVLILMPDEERADLITEMRWAQGERDAIRDRILAEFEKVRAERDEALAAIEGALESHERRLELNTKQLRAVLAKAKGES